MVQRADQAPSLEPPRAHAAQEPFALGLRAGYAIAWAPIVIVNLPPWYAFVNRSGNRDAISLKDAFEVTPSPPFCWTCPARVGCSPNILSHNPKQLTQHKDASSEMPTDTRTAQHRAFEKLQRGRQMKSHPQ